MTEKEYQEVKAKVEREWPARLRLAKLAGLKHPEERTLGELIGLALVNADDGTRIADHLNRIRQAARAEG